MLTQITYKQDEPWSMDLQGKWRLGLYTYETHHVLSLNVKCTRVMTEMLSINRTLS